MNLKLSIAVALMACSSLVYAGGGHDHKPKHGGIVSEANDLDFELVAKADSMVIHVRDHGKAANTAGATGKLTVLAGTDKQELALAPAADGKMEAKGSFKLGAGTRVVAQINLAGKKVANVRFALK